MSTHTPDQDHVPPTDSIAPDFRLESAPGQTVSLHCLRGQLVILAFYPGDWRPVCGDQLQQLQEYLPQIEAHGAQLLAISVDSSWSHQALARTWGLSFPLLADFEPKGAVARAYGVYRAVDGTSERALFLIDRDGVMRWSYAAPIALDPGVDGLLTALERFQSSSQP